VLFVFAVHQPEPHRRMLDRFLVLAEYANLPALVGVNKMDLDDVGPDGVPRSRAIFGDYVTVYPVLHLSARTEQGIAELRDALQGKITAVAGPTGVGNSSLLNVLDPEGRREVADISAATGKGRHTTIATQLYRLDPTTYIADTPGIRALAMHGVPAEDLDRFFPEFRPWLGRCFYADCTHLHEPGCAVREALDQGKIPPARYESYAALCRGDPADD
jgi:ribosome biogenesis GTPase